MDGENRLRTVEIELNRIAGGSLAPSGRNVYFRLTQGKPGYMFSAMVHSSPCSCSCSSSSSTFVRFSGRTGECAPFCSFPQFIPPLSRSKPPLSQTGTKDDDEGRGRRRVRARGRVRRRVGHGAIHIQTLGYVFLATSGHRLEMSKLRKASPSKEAKRGRFAYVAQKSPGVKPWAWQCFSGYLGCG
jgi:hypothetical protein